MTTRNHYSIKKGERGATNQRNIERSIYLNVLEKLFGGRDIGELEYRAGHFGSPHIDAVQTTHFIHLNITH